MSYIIVYLYIYDVGLRVSVHLKRLSLCLKLLCILFDLIFYVKN